MRPAWHDHPAFFAPLVAAAVLLVAGCSRVQATSSLPASGSSYVLSPATASPAPASVAAATASPTAADSPTGLATPLSPVNISLAKVIGGLPHPIGVESAGDGRLFVIDQAGKILIVNGGKVTGTFLDLSGHVSTNGAERGLLGLAFHPNYASKGLFYVRYTTPVGDVRISEFHVSANPDRADPTSERVLLTIPHRLFPNHNGGKLAFGPDGYLYVGTGDGGGEGDPYNNGQNLGSLLGKMLRIDPDNRTGSLPYAIPPGNPFAGQSGRRAEIWSYGLRNPYQYSFDRQTGDLWVADVGQNLWEEVDRATAAGGLGQGANYGWSVMEGDHCYKPASGCATGGKVLPLAEYNHGANDSNGCAIQGGFVYRGTAHPELVGRYFFSDYCSGRIWDVAADGPASQKIQQLLTTRLAVTGWGQGSDGELYLTATNGILYQLR